MEKRDREFEKEENLITKINNGGGYYSEEDEVFLKRMASEGILRKSRGKYFLTSYGETIKIMGYKVHLETKKLENDLPRHNRESNFFIITFSFFFFLVIGISLIALSSGDEFF